MTDYAALVMSLKPGRTWQELADLCNEEGERRYSRRYYWRIAQGTLPASPAAQECILRATSKVTAVTSTETRDTRKTIHASIEVFARLEAAKTARGDVTWDTLMDEAAGLLEEVGR